MKEEITQFARVKSNQKRTEWGEKNLIEFCTWSAVRGELKDDERSLPGRI